MTWKNKLDEAVNAMKTVADTDVLKTLTAKARQTAATLTQRAKAGAMSAAETFIAANTDPATFKVRYLNADVSVVSPSDDLAIRRPHPGTIVIADGAGNGLVIDASADPAYVAETVGAVAHLSANTYDLGTEDGINVVVLKE